MFKRYVYDQVSVRKRHGLPHWQVPGGIYFVTWRLAGSLPVSEEIRLREMRDRLADLRMQDGDRKSAHALEREIFRLLERGLDRPRGEAFMLRQEVAAIVAASLERPSPDYELVTHSVMPNHVHAVFRLLGDLDAVMQQWKSATAHKANKILGRRGTFWAEDYFDVLMRNSRQLERVVRYVQNNPSKAELFGWQWSRTFPEVYATMV